MILPSEASRTSLLRSDPMPPGNLEHDDAVNQALRDDLEPILR
jgi:hypothetical protein